MCCQDSQEEETTRNSRSLMCTRAGTVYNLNSDLEMDGMEEVGNNSDGRAEEGNTGDVGIRSWWRQGCSNIHGGHGTNVY